MAVGNSGGADDFIQAPDGAGSAITNGVSEVPNAVAEVLSDPAPGIGQTEAILGVVAVLVLAGLLLFLRNAIRKSLIAGRAAIDSANAASWAWYFALLLIGALVVAGVVGGLFASTAFLVTASLASIAGVLIAVTMMSRARRSA